MRDYRNLKLVRASLLSATIVASAFNCSTAFAQAAAPAASDAATADTGEIIVTAQRREERLKDVPMSVTAISPVEMTRLGVTETKNLQFVTPGLTFPEDNGTINPYIRGRGTNFSGPGLEGSVAMYIDDVYLQTQFGAAGLVDMQQLQVLKGPQGTLYGRNATGGALLINTANPTHQFEGHVEVGYGRFNTSHIEGVLNVPLGDTLAVRFAGGYDNRDGYVRDVVDNRKVGAAYRYQARVKALWEPTDRFSALLKAEYQESQADYFRRQLIDGTNQPTGLGFYETHQSPQVPKSSGGEDLTKVWSGSLKLNYKGDHFAVSNITSYRSTKLSSCSDNEFIYADSFSFCPNLPGIVQLKGVTTIPNRLDPNAPSTLPGAYDHTFINETRLTTSFDGMFNFLLGGSYQKTHARFGAAFAGTSFGSLVAVFDNFTNIENIAIYGEGYAQVTPQLKLTVGGRYSRDNKDIQGYNNADLAFAIGLTPADIPASFHRNVSFNSFTPRVVLAYDMGNANFYASYSAGFKSGGFNIPTIFPQAPLRPEKIDGFEVGTKLRLMDNTLWLDLAGFLQKSRDIQVASIDTNTGSVVQQNAASAKAYGIEANLRYAPTRDLTVQIGGSWLHSRYTKFENASVFDVGPNPNIPGHPITINGATENLSGFATPLSPDFAVNGNVTYQFDLGHDWGGSLTASARWTDSYDYQAGAGGPQRYARQDAFTVVNLSGEITPPGGKVVLSWYVNNLFNTKYNDQVQTNAQTGAILVGGGVYTAAALPRTFGGRVRVNF